jgi:hypothetical protein
MLIILVVGALVALITLTRLDVDARHYQPGVALEVSRRGASRRRPSSGWTGAMLARYAQSVAVTIWPSFPVQVRG